MSAKTLYKVKRWEIVYEIITSKNTEAASKLLHDRENYRKYSSGWQQVNLDEFMAKFDIIDEGYNTEYNKRKFSFWVDGKEFEIVYAVAVPYFRIRRKTYTDRRGIVHDKDYVGLDLKDPSIPKTFQGKARKAEQLRLTHFKMTYKKGTI